MPGFSKTLENYMMNPLLDWRNVPDSLQVTFTTCCKQKQSADASTKNGGANGTVSAAYNHQLRDSSLTDYFSFGVMATGASGRYEMCWDRGFLQTGTLVVAGPYNSHFVRCDYGDCKMKIVGESLHTIKASIVTKENGGPYVSTFYIIDTADECETATAASGKRNMEWVDAKFEWEFTILLRPEVVQPKPYKLCWNGVFIGRLVIGGPQFYQDHECWLTGTCELYSQAVYEQIGGGTTKIINKNVLNRYPKRYFFGEGIETEKEARAKIAANSSYLDDQCLFNGVHPEIVARDNAAERERMEKKRKGTLANYVRYSGDVAKRFKKKVDGVEYDFFYGDVELEILDPFTTASVQCYNHGSMGGINLIKYSPDCPAAGENGNCLHHPESEVGVLKVNGNYGRGVRGIKGNVYRFNGENDVAKYDGDLQYGVSVGKYILKNVPESHPIAVMNAVKYSPPNPCLVNGTNVTNTSKVGCENATLSYWSYMSDTAYVAQASTTTFAPSLLGDDDEDDFLASLYLGQGNTTNSSNVTVVAPPDPFCDCELCILQKDCTEKRCDCRDMHFFYNMPFDIRKEVKVGNYSVCWRAPNPEYFPINYTAAFIGLGGNTSIEQLKSNTSYSMLVKSYTSKNDKSMARNSNAPDLTLRLAPPDHVSEEEFNQNYYPLAKFVSAGDLKIYGPYLGQVHTCRANALYRCMLKLRGFGSFYGSLVAISYRAIN